MRTILIDWLVQVHLRFSLLQETLYLTVAIIDRFLQVSCTAYLRMFVFVILVRGFQNLHVKGHDR